MLTFLRSIKVRGLCVPASKMLCVLVLSATACNEMDEDAIHASQIGRWLHLTDANGLASNRVNTLFRDSNGRVWVGTSSGLSVFSDNSFATYTILDGLLDSRIYAISEDNEGRIWVGSLGGVNILEDGKWYYFSYFYNAPVLALLHLKNDQGMLIGTGGYGIHRFDYQQPGFSLFNGMQDCNNCNSINSMMQSRDGAVWVASSAGVRRIRGTFITQFDAEDGLSGNVTTSLAEDSWDNVWVGTFDGKTISKIQGNTVAQVDFYNGSQRNFTRSILEDDDGNLWIGTSEKGLFRYDGAIMKPVTDGPTVNKTVTALLKDSRGNLWVGTSNDGVAVYINNRLP